MKFIFYIYRLFKWGATVNIFFRSKAVPHVYHAASPKAHNRVTHVSIVWELKKVGSDDTMQIVASELLDKFEQCSPYEALSGVKL